MKISATTAGEEFRIGITVCDSTGAPIKTTLPVFVQLFDPSGKEVTPYRTYTATDPVSGQAWVAIPRSPAIDPAGRWTVQVTEMISSQMASQPFSVPSRGRSLGLK